MIRWVMKFYWMQLYNMLYSHLFELLPALRYMYIEIGSGSFASMWFWFCLCMFVLNAPCWLKSWRWSARSTRFRATGVAVRLGRKLLARLIDVERGCLGRAERIWGIKSRPARNQSKVQQCQPNSTEANWVKSRQLLSAICRLFAFLSPLFWAAWQRTKWQSTSKPITFLYFSLPTLLILAA